MSDKVVFRLKKHWKMKIDDKVVVLYEEIKAGRKTSEWRDTTRYWMRVLAPSVMFEKMTRAGFSDSPPEDLTKFLSKSKAWFTTGFPKNNVPRLEADITGLIYHPASCQLEIQIANVKEVTDPLWWALGQLVKLQDE